jgi:Na+/proline symporter
MVTVEAATPQTMRRMGLVAGVALVAMAILAGFANFGVIERLVTDGDAAKTAHDI